VDKPEIVRFGAFQFNHATGILTRGIHSSRLPEQAARVLSILIGQQGELVSRKFLCELLWPDVSVNEYDQGINNIISRLRGYLRDNSQKPVFIETIPKRGYRFLPEVEVLSYSAETSDAIESEAVENPLALEAAAGGGKPPEATIPQRRAALWFFRSPLRGITASILLVLLLCCGVLVHLLQKKGSPPELTTLAIAPFQISSNDPAVVQMADSLRMDLTDSLSQLPGLEVRASHSFPSHVVGSNERGSYATQLNVDEILFVQFQKNAGDYALDIELVRSRGLTHMASWHYEGTSEQLDSIIQKARDDIFSATRGEKSNHPTHGGTDNAEAYEIYLRGRYHARQRLPDPLSTAIQEFQQAIKLDPNFANAYTGLADAYIATGDYSIDSLSHAYPLAQNAVTRAVALDPSLAEAHALLGYLLFRKDWSFAEGEAHLREAIRLDNAKASYHLWLSIMLTDERRFDEAAKEIEQAKKDDPFWAPVYGDEAYLEANLHQFNKLNNTINTLVNLKPDWSGSYDERAWSYWLSGHHEQAIIEWRRMAVMDHEQTRVDLEDRGMAAFRSGGAKAYARIRYDASISGKQFQHADSDFQPAEWAAYMGDYQTAIKILSNMVAKHDIACLDMSINSAYIPLYNDPKFQQLLSKVGLPKP
jgi:DNA-binding winged helix-turn-helix (wHTH) protein/tetratricopeptide (TPR) repeat protein